MDWFGARRFPYLTRRNYFYEMVHLLPWGVLAGLVEGNMAGVVVAKTFGGGSILITIATATPTAAHVINIVWGYFAGGRPMLPLFRTFALAVSLVVASIFVTPRSPLGGVLFVVQMGLAQMLLSAVVTLRSGLWKLNYPTSVRGRMTARLQGLRAFMGVVATLGASWCFDADPGLYRYVYLAAAACGVLGVVIAGHMHVRGEWRYLGTNTKEAGATPAVSLGGALSLTTVLREMSRVFRNDPKFYRYCKAQMCLGSANLMTAPIMVDIFARRLALPYTGNLVLLDVLPKALMLATLPLWGRLLDRIGVVRARVVNSLCWTTMMLFGLVGTLFLEHAEWLGPSAMMLTLAMFTLSRIGHGLGSGGGTLMWNIGHLHFAAPREAELYMGIHVSLTGFRAIFATFIGMFLYQHFGAIAWLLALAMSVLSIKGFADLADEERQEGRSMSK